MNYSIMFKSVTGNTELLANTVLHALPLKKCTYFGGFNKSEVEKSDIIFVGFGAENDTCTEDVAEFLKTLKNKRIALFGTVNAANENGYFDSIISKVAENISSENEIVGGFICKGDMYKEPKKDNPNILFTGSDYSSVHPNIIDLVNIRDFARNMYYFM